MIWPFSRERRACFPVGPYRLNGSITALPGMIDLSAAELLALDSQVQFQGERILHAPSVNFLDHNWDTILGTVDNQIYKVALQISGLSRSDGGAITRSVLVYITKQQEKRPKSEGPMSVWNAADGNIIFQDAWLGTEFVLNLFLTSSAVAGFHRI